MRKVRVIFRLHLVTYTDNLLEKRRAKRRDAELARQQRTADLAEEFSQVSINGDDDDESTRFMTKRSSRAALASALGKVRKRLKKYALGKVRDGAASCRLAAPLDAWTRLRLPPRRHCSVHAGQRLTRAALSIYWRL